MSSAAQIAYAPCGFLDQRDAIAAEVMSRMFAADMSLRDAQDRAEMDKYREDIGFHILYLAEAIAARAPGLFRNYTDWVEDVLNGLGFRTDQLQNCFRIIAAVLQERDYLVDADIAVEYLNHAITRLGSPKDATISSLDTANEPAQHMLAELLACRRSKAFEIVEKAEANGLPLADIYLQLFQPALREVGRLWQQNKISVAQEHYCSAAIQLMMGRLAAKIFSSKRNGYTIVSACVGKELHEIGLRMIADIMEASGWETHFLGANVPTGDLVAMVRDTRADALCLSVTLTSNLFHLNEVILAMRAETDLQHVKIIVGGYPFILQPDLWRTVGADGHAPDAASVNRICLDLVEQ